MLNELSFVSSLLYGVGYPDALKEPLTNLATALGAVNTSLIVVDKVRNDDNLYEASNITPDMLALYQPEIALDPWYIASTARSGAFTSTGSMLVPQREYRRSRFYSDYVRRVDHEHLGITGSIGPEFDVFLVANRSPRQDDFETAALHTLGRMFPFVMQFARLHLAIRRTTGNSSQNSMDIGTRGLHNLGKDVPDLIANIAWLRIEAGSLFATGPEGAQFRAACATCQSGMVPANTLFCASTSVGTVQLRVLPARRFTSTLQREWFARVEIEAVVEPTRNWTRIRAAYALTETELALLKAL